MSLYPKIDDYSILLDSDCKRMLRRSSRKLIIYEVLDKINKIETSEDSKKVYNFHEENIKYFDISNNKIEKKTKFYEIILYIFGCNIN